MIKLTTLKLPLLILLIAFVPGALAQNYSYFSIGDTSDVTTATEQGICLMGGATEDDNGAAWFLSRSGGGNVVVIRASGSDGYNSYFFNDLGVSLQSVETIIFNSPAAATDPFVLRRLEQAEAIWMAGGDQYVYDTYWKNSPVMDILNNHVNVKKAPIGGTSAGMAILGQYYFNAEVSSVTSSAALANPYNSGVTISSNFLAMPFLSNTITDTHYNNPDRKGRHATFLARLTTDNGGDSFYGIAANEYVAICINENGLATVYGGYPTYPDAAYFIRMNCFGDQPEVILPNTPLTWNTNNKALFVFKANATANGLTTFDLTNWTSGNGGTWENWNINEGILSENASAPPNCASGINSLANEFSIYPNPASDFIHISSNELSFDSVRIIDSKGAVISSLTSSPISVEHFETGLYTLEIISKGVIRRRKVAIHN